MLSSNFVGENFALRSILQHFKAVMSHKYLHIAHTSCVQRDHGCAGKDAVASAKGDSGAFRLPSQIEKGERDQRVKALTLDMNVVNMLVCSKIKPHRVTLLQ